jgi:hypothetical protein
VLHCLIGHFEPRHGKEAVLGHVRLEAHAAAGDQRSAIRAELVVLVIAVPANDCVELIEEDCRELPSKVLEEPLWRVLLMFDRSVQRPQLVVPALAAGRSGGAWQGCRIKLHEGRGRCGRRRARLAGGRWRWRIAGRWSERRDNHPALEP